MYSLYQIFLYISSFVSIVLALFILIKNKRDGISVSFSLFCLSVCVWLCSYAQVYDSSTLETALIWSKIGFIGILFIPLFAFLFVLYFIEIKINKILLFLFSLINISFIGLLFCSNLIIDQISTTSWGLYPHAGKIHVLFMIYSLIMFLISVFYSYKYIQQPETTSVKKQKAIQIILVYVVFALLFIFDNLFFYDFFQLEPISYLTVLFYLIFISIIILNYNLVNIKVLSIKTLVFICMAILVLIITKYILIFSTNIYISNFITFMLTIGCFFIYKKIVAKTEIMLSYKNKHYQDLLIHAASGMAKEHDLNRLMKLISIIVLKTVKVSFISIFLENKETNNYEAKIIRTYTNTTNELMFSYEQTHPFINYISSKEEPFLFDEMPQYIAHSIILPFRPALVIPSFFEGVKGFVIIGEKSNKDVFTREDINVFKMLARQASLAMENCLFFEKYKQAQEKIFTAEKLASIGGLAEGVAHQIRNRLNHFAMIAGELKYELIEFKEKNKVLLEKDNELKDSFGYFDTLAESLENNVKKTDDVVKGVLDYAKIEAKHTMFENFNLKEVVNLAFDLLKIKHHIADKFSLTNKFNDNDTIFTIKSQIVEVIYNLIDNAYEAIDEKKQSLSKEESLKFIPKIEIGLVKKDNVSILKISDNGIGIKETNMQKIFVPFFTTKTAAKSGTGIGMYIVKRIITENLKGKIELKSVYMKGTDFTIELPNELPKE